MHSRTELLGRLGGDPELKYTQGGTAVCNFSMATDDSYKNRNGERVEDTDWHRIVIWGKLAELVAEHCKKGSLIYAEGKNKTRSWEDRDGNKRYTTEVKVSYVKFLDGKKNGSSAGNGSSGASGGRTNEDAGAQSYPDDDDIPF